MTEKTQVQDTEQLTMFPDIEEPETAQSEEPEVVTPIDDPILELPDRIQKIFSSVDEVEQQYLIQILEELSETGESKTYNEIWLADYKEIPVDWHTFVSNDHYLGKATNHGAGIYPFWMDEADRFFAPDSEYYEWILTGATRIGKTSTAVKAAAYTLYLVMCLRNPQLYFNKLEVSKFSILFFNVTKDQAKGVAFREFNDTLAVSPWFQAHGTFSKSEDNFVYKPEGGKLVIEYGSSAAHGLGKQVLVAFMDECNFAQAGIKDVFKAKTRMKASYDTLYARVAGTFRKHGRIYGKLFACSSRNSDQDFLESHITDQTKIGLGNRIMISGAPQWEVLPPGTFSDGTFAVAVGDRYKRPFVVEDDSPAAIEDLTTQGYEIIYPPVDMKPEFVTDIDIALRDLAGKSIAGSLSFITQDSIDACLSTTRKNPFLNDILQIGVKDSLTIEQFFHLEYVNPIHMKAPMYIHLDLSTNTDRTGISGVSTTGKFQKLDLDGKKLILPMLTHMFSVAIQAPKGDRIPYNKILEFMIWLRRKGFNIYLITRDQYQSDYMAQLLEAQGFKVAKISLDRSPDGYITTRSIIHEQRIDMLHSPELEDEMIHLQRDSSTGRIDHPVGGYKDLSDSFAGATWQASSGDPGPQVSITSKANIIAAVNQPRNTLNVQTSAASALANLQRSAYNNPPNPPSTLPRSGRRPGIIIPKR